MVLAYVDRETVLLVRQYRYALARHFYEVPAGKLDPGEKAFHAARRELRQECGYRAAEWRRLGTFHPCIGYSDEAIELFLARRLTHVGSALDPEEFLEVVPTTLRQALRWVKDGTITDAKTVIALLWADGSRGSYAGRARRPVR